MKKRIYSNKANDLVRFKDEIREMLEQEIVSRYYFQKGIIESTFDDDEDILTAINILNTPINIMRYLKPRRHKRKASRVNKKRTDNTRPLFFNAFMRQIVILITDIIRLSLSFLLQSILNLNPKYKWHFCWRSKHPLLFALSLYLRTNNY